MRVRGRIRQCFQTFNHDVPCASTFVRYGISNFRGQDAIAFEVEENFSSARDQLVLWTAKDLLKQTHDHHERRALAPTVGSNLPALGIEPKPFLELGNPPDILETARVPKGYFTAGLERLGSRRTDYRPHQSREQLKPLMKQQLTPI